MKKFVVIINLLLAVAAVRAQYQSPATVAPPSDTLPPCGRYVVTNGSAIAQSMVESAILNALRSGTAYITSDDDSPSTNLPEVDTSFFVEIIASETLTLNSAGDVLPGVPKSVVIAPQLVTIAHEGSDSLSGYPLSGIVSTGPDGRAWSLLRTDAPALSLSLDNLGIYTLKIPGRKTLRLRRE